MTCNASKKRILVVGDRAALENAHLQIPQDVAIELVKTFEEALNKHARAATDKIFFDPASLDVPGVEVFSAFGAAFHFHTKGIPFKSNLHTAAAYVDTNLNFIWANSAYEELMDVVIDFKNDNYFDFHLNPGDRSVFECVRNTGVPIRLSTVVLLSNLELICTIAPLASPSHDLHGFVISVTHRELSLQPAGNPSNTSDQDLQSTIDRLRAELEQRKLAEEELINARAIAERRANEIESLISGMTDGVVLFDAQGNVRLINSIGKNLLSIESNTSYTDWARSLRRYTLGGQEFPIDRHPLTRALSGERVIDERYRVITNAGHDFIAGVSAAPVKDCQDCVVGATLVFRDISDLVAIEDQKREVYEREHRIAEILQQALIPPQVSYNIDGCKIVVKYQPALDEAAVGGDFYDIFDIGEGKIGILIGDIAGKGLPAAIRVAAARYSIRSYAFLDPSPSVVLTLANQALCKEETTEIGLLTAFFAVVDISTCTITYSNGGHEPPLVLGVDGSIVELGAQGGGLGFYDGFIYAEESLKLGAGDVVIMITDGITEARSAEGVLFDKEGVRQCLLKNRRRNLNSLAQGIVESARMHAGGNLQDDAAVVVVQLEDKLDKSGEKQH